MGNGLSTMLYGLIFSVVKTIWDRLCSVVSTDRVAIDASLDGTSGVHQDHTRLELSQSRETTLHQNRRHSDSHYDDIGCEPAEMASMPQEITKSPQNNALEERYATVTISALTETGREKSSIRVPKQRTFKGQKPIIPSSLANTLCVDLGPEGLLAELNSILVTTCTLDDPSLSSLLEECISNNYDFGTAYGLLRPTWYTKNWIAIQDKLNTYETQDNVMRQGVLANDRIITSEVPPRRVWDLYSNRVVPQSITKKRSSAISHAWVHWEDRNDIFETPINGYEWPVPIPKDADLNLIRIEMLNLGAEYVWLDVLCLRQRGGLREDLRYDEWKVDVPTIGHVYQEAERVVCYFSGLGRPLGFKREESESPYCWFNRAWTLQEGKADSIIGGDLGNGGNMEEDVRKWFHQQLSSLKDTQWALQHVFRMLSQMQMRVSTNPVDRVAALGYLLLSREIPAYHEVQCVEGAWTAVVNVISERCRGQLLFLYPEPGNGNRLWRPSWDQVMTGKLLSMDAVQLQENVGRYDRTDTDEYSGLCIESGFVQGLAEGGEEGWLREGKLIVKDETFEIVAAHNYPIPEGSYTLLSSRPLSPSRHVQEQYWVAGKRLPDNRFQKVSVFQMNDLEEVERLMNLCNEKLSRTILV
ncbi:hypothetical protein EV421DRAFT_1354855 [Armillaria borealis]|uniref:Heterokaryon incompatibility domain-containing protein n=1 Tax=Armillaria borealis TaxID=47425 RepID=A0AA39J246_9AGAR|nr:hypothetical protein EV421DRAFT_1354855 [Armillaria borealis]